MAVETQDVHLSNDYKSQSSPQPGLMRFWRNRHCLFPNWDQGILCDQESLYSITPHVIAQHLADSLGQHVKTVVDICCGVGGNTIVYAQSGKAVVAVDNDANKLVALAHNARICGQSERVVPLHCDYRTLEYIDLWADFVFCSPPWSGLGYRIFHPFRPTACNNHSFAH